MEDRQSGNRTQGPRAKMKGKEEKIREEKRESLV